MPNSNVPIGFVGLYKIEFICLEVTEFKIWYTEISLQLLFWTAACICLLIRCFSVLYLGYKLIAMTGMFCRKDFL